MLNASSVYHFYETKSIRNTNRITHCDFNVAVSKGEKNTGLKPNERSTMNRYYCLPFLFIQCKYYGFIKAKQGKANLF